MSDGYRAVCGDCEWSQTTSSFDRPYSRPADARRAIAAHTGNTGCDMELALVEEVVPDE